MSQRTRIGIIIVVVGLGLAIGGFYVLSRIISTNLQPLPPPTPETIVLEQVIVARRDIELGELLTQSDLQEVNVPVQLIPRNALRRIDQAVEKFTKVQLIAGEMIMTHNLADPTNINHDIPFVLGEDQVLMAFPVKDLMGELDFLERGDLIDIFLTTNVDIPLQDQFTSIAGQPETESIRMTFDAFQRVRITALVVDIVQTQEQQGSPVQVPTGGEGPEPTPTPRPQDINIQAFLLALDPQDALVLKYFNDNGAIFDFVLRSPTSTEFFDLKPVTNDFIVDRYQFEFNR